MREEDDAAFVKRMNDRDRFAYCSNDDRERLCALALAGTNRQEIDRSLRALLCDLIGAVSLLRRGGVAGASSETMFYYKLSEYDRRIEIAQTLVKQLDEQTNR